MLQSRLASVHVLVLSAICLLAIPAFAGAQNSSANGSITTVVTALGPNYTAPPNITKDDISVYSKQAKLNVTSWEPAKGGSQLQLAILIDDAVSPRAIGMQFNDLKDFIEQQPAGTEVGLFYARYGSFTTAAKFSTDHQQVAGKLHLTFGRRSGSSPSIYLSLSDLAKKWPGNPEAARREVLVLTSGMDLLEPGVQDPYFDAAVTNVQKYGVIVHSIYIGPLRLGLSFFGMIAQSNLGQLTSQSGGDAFFEGISTPVSFKPFLNQLDTILRNQYVVSFESPNGAKPGRLMPIDIRVEQKNVKLLYPHHVLVPGK
ncbi:MAG TPA: hypothetical protein VNK23_07725 [Candidatus Dormibacteraeota bacterium]|nr:hypothetical protein [Candidatus Dormibacteraeota bacterium]